MSDFNKKNDIKRLFLGFEVFAPWSENYHDGRVIEKRFRHLTLAFLKMQSTLQMITLLENDLFPIPFKVSPFGIFEKCLFLPKRDPKVIAWHVDWIEDDLDWQGFYDSVVSWLKDHNVHHLQNITKRPFLSHVTMARSPFNMQKWKKNFFPVPMFLKKLHLYESLGHSKYRSLWKKNFLPPFEEIEHTADMAFYVFGKNIKSLFFHAQAALIFTFPSFLPYLTKIFVGNNLADVIININDIIVKMDVEIGCPIKAISFHEKMIKREDGILQWEMILDV